MQTFFYPFTTVWNYFSGASLIQNASNTIVTAQNHLKKPPEHKVKLNFKATVDSTGQKFLFVCQHVGGVQELKLCKSLISNEELQQGIPTLAFNSPDLESIDLAHMYYDQETLDLIAKSFSHLKKINVNCLYEGSMRSKDFANLIIPWIKVNTRLESFKCLENDFTTQNIKDLFASFPSTLTSLLIAFPNEFSKTDFIAVMKMLSEKCQKTFKHLCIGIYSPKSIIDDESLALLPELFPALENLDIRCDTQTTTEATQVTLKKW